MNIGNVHPIKTAAGIAAIPVASGATVNTPSFELHYGDAFGVEFLGASNGDVNVKVSLQLSMDGTNFVEGDGFPDVAVITDKTRHIVQLTPYPAKYGRFQFKGQGSNHATTTMTTNLFIQEQV